MQLQATAPLSSEEVELWAPIKGFEGSYEVSNLGRVRSFKVGRNKPPRIMSPVMTGFRYFQVGLMQGRLRIGVTVHRAVVEAFIGEIPDGREVNHKSGDKRDNRACNLEIVTRSENIKHAYDVLGKWRPIGDLSSCRKLPDVEVEALRWVVGEMKMRHRVAARVFGVSRETVTGIVNFRLRAKNRDGTLTEEAIAARKRLAGEPARGEESRASKWTDAEIEAFRFADAFLFPLGVEHQRVAQLFGMTPSQGSEVRSGRRRSRPKRGSNLF